MEAWLSAPSGRKVTLVVPERGDRRRLVDLATRNAEVSAAQAAPTPAAPGLQPLEGLQQALELPGLPRRIECIDISTLQGSETVARSWSAKTGGWPRVGPASTESGGQG